MVSQRVVPKSFAQTGKYVKPIDGTSRQLKRAIEDGAKIIISTIHKFTTDQLSVLKNEEGKRFAIIIDEAHSSQLGKPADSMAKVLADGELSDEEKELDSTEQALLELQQALLELQRLLGPQAKLSYVAFTATPKNITLERFGQMGENGVRALPPLFDAAGSEGRAYSRHAAQLPDLQFLREHWKRRSRTILNCWSENQPARLHASSTFMSTP